MRRMGFSSGALAYSDFRKGVSMLDGKNVRVLELSALREPELRPMITALENLDLGNFDYIAVHAPSAFRPDDEAEIVELLLGVSRRGWAIILHPDAVHDWSLWTQLGASLCIENMDKRKPIGRTVAELTNVFDRLPNAKFCFDIGHARQVDSTMTEAYLILKTFGSRLQQVHISEVNTRSKHDPLSIASILAFREVSALIPDDIPIILESPVREDQIAGELKRADEALPTTKLRIRDLFSPQEFVAPV